MRQERKIRWTRIISGLRGRKRRISAGLHNLLLGVTRSARRLPRDWRYYALPVLILVCGVTAAYGRTQGINLLDLTGRMQHLQGSETKFTADSNSGCSSASLPLI